MNPSVNRKCREDSEVMVLTSSTKIGREGNDHRNQGQRGGKNLTTKEEEIQHSTEGIMHSLHS
jgi:hypothetical protein